MTMIRNRLVLVVLMVAIVVVMAGCGEDDATSTPSGPTAGPTSPTDPEPSISEPSITPLYLADCTTDAIEGVVVAELDPDGVIPGTVQISECENPYARVFYVPDSPGYESEQVFLLDRQGEWEILTYGTGIDCATDTDFEPPELETACMVLGLRA